jgi:glycosyltransferase involved in cell wall biosynthesis
MVELLNDRRKADGIGVRGRQIALDSYSWEAIAERHLGFYEAYL